MRLYRWDNPVQINKANVLDTIKNKLCGMRGDLGDAIAEYKKREDATSQDKALKLISIDRIHGG